MGKPTGKKKKMQSSWKKHSRTTDHSLKVFDEDTSICTDMSHGMKLTVSEEDYEGVILKYEKAIKLLPKNHVDVAYLRSNLAACYMQMGPGEYHRAINECNLALEASPKYTKALLKRAKCFESWNRLKLACRDINSVLALEPNNLTALEISERIKEAMGKKGIKLDDKEMLLPPEVAVMREKVGKEKNRKKKSHKVQEKVVLG